MNVLSTFLVPAESGWQRAGWLLLAIFIVFALVAGKVASTVFAVLFLAGLWLLLRRRTERPGPLPAWVLASFAAYFLAGVLAYFISGEQTRLGEQLLGRDIRFLGAIPVYFAIRALRLPPRALLAGLGLAGALTGVFAVLQVALGDELRATGASISILFGHLSAALAVVNLALALRGVDGTRGWAMAGAAGGLAAVLLSGTRGAALTVLIIGGLVCLTWCGRDGRRWLKAGTAAAVVVAMIALTPLAQNLLDRLGDGKRQVAEHVRADAILAKYAAPEQLPACLDAPELLHWLLASGNVRVAGNTVAIQVIENADFAPVTGTRCAGGAFLRVDNTGPKHVSIVLPERSVAPDGGSGGSLLLRGKGAVRLATAGSAVQRFNFKQPRRLDLDTKPDESAETMARTLVDVSVGAQVDLVILATAPGEYRYMDASGPIVSRLYMWRIAASGFLGAPLLGVGTGAFPALLETHARSGAGPWQLVQYDHAHNEFLTVAAERGIAGVLALLLVYLAPFLLFHRRGDASGAAGMALVSAFVLSGLTETIFNHSLAITYYCVLVFLLATAPLAVSRPPPRTP